jgi:hypothetical protein
MTWHKGRMKDLRPAIVEYGAGDEGAKRSDVGETSVNDRPAATNGTTIDGVRDRYRLRFCTDRRATSKVALAAALSRLARRLVARPIDHRANTPPSAPFRGHGDTSRACCIDRRPFLPSRGPIGQRPPWCLRRFSRTTGQLVSLSIMRRSITAIYRLFAPEPLRKTAPAPTLIAFNQSKCVTVGTHAAFPASRST